MSHWMVECLGYIGSAITSVQFIPQVVKTYKERSAKGVSATTFLICLIGCLVWIVYGLMIESIPIVLTNVIAACLATSMLIAKWVFKSRDCNTNYE